MFSYWPDEERSKMEMELKEGRVLKTKYYAPDFERELINSSGGLVTLAPGGVLNSSTNGP